MIDVCVHSQKGFLPQEIGAFTLLESIIVNINLSWLWYIPLTS